MCGPAIVTKQIGRLARQGLSWSDHIAPSHLNRGRHCCWLGIPLNRLGDSKHAERVWIQWTPRRLRGGKRSCRDAIVFAHVRCASSNKIDCTRPRLQMLGETRGAEIPLYDREHWVRSTKTNAHLAKDPGRCVRKPSRDKQAPIPFPCLVGLKSERGYSDTYCFALTPRRQQLAETLKLEWPKRRISLEVRVDYKPKPFAESVQNRL